MVSGKQQAGIGLLLVGGLVSFFGVIGGFMGRALMMTGGALFARWFLEGFIWAFVLSSITRTRSLRAILGRARGYRE
jgi:hypothetical protein